MIKQDNHNLQAKLDLRRHFLRQLPMDRPLSVLDCFSGSEVIWTKLRTEFNVGEYLALDTKAKANRLKLDSLKYLQVQRWQHDVIDLDAYGSPWRHWMEVLKRGQNCIVFLTVGNLQTDQKTIGNLSNRQFENAVAEFLGITFATERHAELQPFSRVINGLCLDYLLDQANVQGFNLKEVTEAVNKGGNARYFGLELRRKELKSNGESVIIKPSAGTCRESVRPAASEPQTTGQPAVTGDAEKE